MDLALAALIALRTLIAAAAFALAALSFRARPKATENRLLAAFLILVGASAAITPIRHLFPMSYEREMWSAAAFRGVGISYFPLLLAIAGTFRVPLARPFATRAGIAFSCGLTGAILVWTFLFPGWLIVMRPTADGWTSGYYGSTPAFITAGTVLVTTYALLVGIQAIRRARRGSLERAQAIALVLAVAAIVSVGAANALIMVALNTIDPQVHVSYMGAMAGAYPAMTSIAALVGIVILALGMLRLQLLEVDLRVKWTIRRGTVVGAIVASAVIVAELAQIWVSSTLGVVAGLAAALLLLVVKRPLERFAERVANAAMPGVDNTREWREARAAELYRTAVRLALADGTVNAEEESQLETFAKQLGLEAARAIELRLDVLSAIETARPSVATS